MAFGEKERIALYMSDVSAAFDRVSMDRMVAKLAARGVPDYLLCVFKAWLRARSAEVVVNGHLSMRMLLEDMVFQGTVWGPMLWNIFYQDAASAIRSSSFVEIVFADDLNAFKIYDNQADEKTMRSDMNACQEELHAWGRANQVAFDASKESQHILGRTTKDGSNFNLLGVRFDCKLLMTDTVFELGTTCQWKLRAILRTQRFNTSLQLVLLYKAQLLSCIEYRTTAIYHACQHSLDALERVQDKLLEATGMTRLDVLINCNLAPLATRRDIALLGLIHRTVLGHGPAHFSDFFQVDNGMARKPGRHRLQLCVFTNGDVSDFMFPGSRPADYI